MFNEPSSTTMRAQTHLPLHVQCSIGSHDCVELVPPQLLGSLSLLLLPELQLQVLPQGMQRQGILGRSCIICSLHPAWWAMALCVVAGLVLTWCISQEGGWAGSCLGGLLLLGPLGRLLVAVRLLRSLRCHVALRDVTNDMGIRAETSDIVLRAVSCHMQRWLQHPFGRFPVRQGAGAMPMTPGPQSLHDPMEASLALRSPGGRLPTHSCSLAEVPLLWDGG